jgi:hypothetical protein
MKRYRNVWRRNCLDWVDGLAAGHLQPFILFSKRNDTGVSDHAPARIEV